MNLVLFQLILDPSNLTVYAAIAASYLLLDRRLRGLEKNLAVLDEKLNIELSTEDLEET